MPSVEWTGIKLSGLARCDSSWPMGDKPMVTVSDRQALKHALTASHLHDPRLVYHRHQGFQWKRTVLVW